MAGEIQTDYTAGATLYAQVRTATGTIWNTAGSVFQAYNTANIADYDIAMAEQGTASGYYTGTFPVVPADVYNVVVKVQAGAGPAESDVTVAAGAFEWDGSAVVPLSSRASQTSVEALPTLAEILDGGDVDGYSLEETLKLCLAALAGKLSGAGGTTITIRAADDSTDRIVATVDVANGNRSAVTLDAAG